MLAVILWRALKISLAENFAAIRMGEAIEKGANAVVNVRFSTSSITAGASELYAYGTAVVVE